MSIVKGKIGKEVIKRWNIDFFSLFIGGVNLSLNDCTASSLYFHFLNLYDGFFNLFYLLFNSFLLLTFRFPNLL